MNKSIVVLSLLTGIFIWGCSSGGGGNPPVITAEEYLAQGWQAYAAKNYPMALSDFDNAAQSKPTLYDAFNGAGWANAKLANLPAANTDFNDGLTKNPGNIQITAGLALVFGAQKLYDSSITRAGQVLAADSLWVFSRDTSVNHFDLHLLLAEDYFAKADFASSLVQVQILNPAFSADVTVIAGQTALAQEIERLGTIY